MEAVSTQDLGMDDTGQLVDPIVLPTGQEAVEAVFREPEAIDLTDVESIRTVLNALLRDAGNATIMGGKDVRRSGDEGQCVVVCMHEGNRVSTEPMAKAVPRITAVPRFPEVDPTGHDSVRIEGIHRESEIIESLTTEVHAVDRVPQEVGYIGNLCVARSTVGTEVNALQSLGAGSGANGPDFIWRNRRSSECKSTDSEGVGQS